MLRVRPFGAEHVTSVFKHNGRVAFLQLQPPDLVVAPKPVRRPTDGKVFGCSILIDASLAGNAVSHDVATGSLVVSPSAWAALEDWRTIRSLDQHLYDALVREYTLLGSYLRGSLK